MVEKKLEARKTLAVKGKPGNDVCAKDG